MNFPADAPVTPEKKDALRARILALAIDLARVDAVAVKGSGPGGQKMNKTSSGVQLRYALGEETLVVKWTRERSQAATSPRSGSVRCKAVPTWPVAPSSRMRCITDRPRHA